MSEWREVKLGDVVDVFDHRRVPLSSSQRSSRRGPYPYYGAQGVIDSIDEFIFDGRFILVPEDGENLRSRKLPVAYLAAGQFWVNNHAHVIRGKPGIANDRFIQSALEAADIGAFVTGAAQPKLSQANLRQLPILLPSIEDQQTVAAVLDAINDLIEHNQQRIELLERVAQAIYEEWFVRFRYAGHEDTILVDSPLGPIPDCWDVRTIGEVLEFKYGKALRSGDRRGGSVAVVGSSNVVGWHDEKLIDGPAIVVGRKGNVGNVVWVPSACWPIDTTYYVVTTLPLRYVYEQLARADFINSHAAVPGLSRDQAYSLPFLLPSGAVAEAFGKIADDLGSAAQCLRGQSGHLAAIRDLLLPKLVTGQIDVSGLDLNAVLESVA